MPELYEITETLKDGTKKKWLIMDEEEIIQTCYDIGMFNEWLSDNDIENPDLTNAVEFLRFSDRNIDLEEAVW